MAADWFYKKHLNGKECGPVTSAQLRRLAEAGDIGRDTIVRKTSHGKWVFASAIKGLFDGLVEIGTSPPSATFEVSDLKTAPRSEDLHQESGASLPPPPLGVPMAMPVAPAHPGYVDPPQLHSASQPQARSKGGWGKSIVLLLIGGILLFVAFSMNSRADSLDKLSTDIAFLTMQSDGLFAGRPVAFKEPKKEDRAAVFAVAGIGAMFILGGIVTWGGNKK